MVEAKSLQTTATATTVHASAVGGNRRRVLNAADLDAATRKGTQRRLGARAGGLGEGK